MEYVCLNINKIVLKNKEGKESVLNCIDSFDENIDSITIKTQIPNSELFKGWVGDLLYKTSPAFDILTDIEHDGIEDSYKDLVLVKIKPHFMKGECVSWEYVFIKD